MTESPLEKLRRLQAEKEGRAVRGATKSPEGKSLKRGGIGAIFVAVLFFIATKGKLVILFVLTKGKLLFGAVKLGPLLTTFSTMGLSMWIYAGHFGASLAIGIVLLILVHEIGHGVAARALKLKVGTPIFIPFFGAMIALKDQPRSTWEDSVIGAGGPVFGALGGVGVLLVGSALAPGDFRNLLLVLAWFTFLINLFNLMPVWQLDGARITSPVRPLHWLAILAVLTTILTIEAQTVGRVNPFLLIIVLLGGFRAAHQWWKGRKAKEPDAGRLLDRLTERKPYAEEDQVTPAKRHAAAAVYTLLAAGLALLTLYAAHLGPGAHGLS